MTVVVEAASQRERPTPPRASGEITRGDVVGGPGGDDPVEQSVT